MSSIAIEHARVARARPVARRYRKREVGFVALLLAMAVVAIVLGIVRFVICGERSVGALSWR